MNLKLLTRSEIDEGFDLDFDQPQRPGARPFDLSELDKLPQPTDDDPPYRSWWVVDKF
jgi:hypothetical protein